MGKTNNPIDIVDKLASLKPASFLDEKTQLPQDDYILQLSEGAEFVIEQFLSNALLVSQYKKYQEARAAGSAPSAALVATNASEFEQELAYELLKMTKAYGVIGGSVLYRTNCPDIELLDIAAAHFFEETFGLDFCIPVETKDSDRWLIVNLDPIKLKQKIKEDIEDLLEEPDPLKNITDALKQWIIDNFDDPGINPVIQDIIQQLIDQGKIKDGNGRPIIIPDQPPPAPTAGAGTPGITKTAAGTVNYTKVCGTPQIIAHKDLTGIRSILVFANLIPVEIGPLQLRGAVDSFGKLTFDNYKPRNLVSATFILVGAATKQLVATIPPTPTVTANYTNAPALAHNNIVEVIPGNSTREIGFNIPIDGVEVGEQLTLEYFGGPGSQLKIGNPAGPLRCSAITFQGLVTPVPVLVQAIDLALNNKSGLDLFLTCLEIRSTDGKEYDIPFNILANSLPPYGVQGLHDNAGILATGNIAGVGFRNTNQGNFGLGYVGSFLPSTTYKVRVKFGRNDGQPVYTGTQTISATMYRYGSSPDGPALASSGNMAYYHAQNSIVEIPITTPVTLNECEIYLIWVQSTYPDVFYTEIGIVK
jgi:hypothetical protein